MFDPAPESPRQFDRLAADQQPGHRLTLIPVAMKVRFPEAFLSPVTRVSWLSEQDAVSFVIPDAESA